MYDYFKCFKKEFLEKFIFMDAFIICSMIFIISDFLKFLINLKFIVRVGVGVDNIDLESCF